MAPRILLVAGEPSGDQHGAELVRELRARLPQARIEGLGGEQMAEAGMEMLYNLPHQLAIMGFWAVAFRLPRIGRLLSVVRAWFDRHPPDLVVLIDYPGFNGQVARLAHNRGIRVAYFITPQVWAWASSRVHRLGRLCDLLLVILPFEERIYADHGYNARFVGHPLTEQLQAFRQRYDQRRASRQLPPPLQGDDPVLGLLPGSRRQEVRGVLPIMLRAAARLLDQLQPAPRLVLASRAGPLPDGVARQVARVGAAALSTGVAGAVRVRLRTDGNIRADRFLQRTPHQ